MATQSRSSSSRSSRSRSGGSRRASAARGNSSSRSARGAATSRSAQSRGGRRSATSRSNGTSRSRSASSRGNGTSSSRSASSRGNGTSSSRSASSRSSGASRSRSASSRSNGASRSRSASSRSGASRSRSASSRGGSRSASSRSRNQRSLPRALALLAKDHRSVEKLFREFENGGGRASREDIAMTICKELKVHATLEEELFYPALAQASGDKSMVGEAIVEHSVVRGLVQKIESMDASADWFKETITVLQELIEHHVEEEESELFAKARRSGIDLDDLGLWMMQRKAQLRAENGLPEQEDLKLDVRETARLRELEEAGPATRFIGRVSQLVSNVTH